MIFNTIMGQLFLMVLALVIPACAFVCYLVVGYANLEQERLKEGVLNLSHALQVSLDQELVAIKATARELSVSSSLQNGNFESFYQRAKRSDLGDGYVVVSTPDGQQLMNTLVPWGTALPQVPAETHPDLVVRHVAHVSDVFIGNLKREYVFCVKVPVIVGGEFKYVLGLTFPLLRIQQLLDQHKIQEPQVAAIVDGTGKFAARSVRPAGHIGASVPASFMKSVQNGSGTWHGVNVDGRELFAYYQHSNVSGWIVSLGLPEVLLEYPRRKLILLLFISGISVCLIAVIIAALFGNRIVRSVDALIQIIDACASGKEPAVTHTNLYEIDRAAAHTVDFAQQRKLMINELNHRVKNTLAVVQSIVQMTLRSSRPEDVRENLEGRLMSLAATHDQLTATEWQEVGIEAILKREMSMYDGRVSFEGPACTLKPQTALAVGMSIHELATNAVKYGSLKQEHGRVTVTWTVVEHKGVPWLHMLWREHDGPTVEKPFRKGFGSQVISAGIVSIGGVVVVDYAADGLRCNLEVPV